MERVRIGFDLGGTNMGAALVSLNGEILFVSEGQTLPDRPSEDLTARMKKLIRNCINEASTRNLEVSSIGMGSPGVIDTDAGIVKTSPNIPQWKNIEIGKIIYNEFNIPFAIDNDVRVTALGEYYFGAGKGYKNILCIAVGTGIGGGLILNGKLIRGATQSAGEIGHMTLKKDGPLCGCGNYGCMEAMASSLAIIREASKVIEERKSSLMKELLDNGESMGAYLVSKAAEMGDPEALRIMTESGEWIGTGLSNVINLINPEIIIIGGGVSLAGNILFDPIRKEISKRALKIPGNYVKVVPALLGDNAGMIGASTLIN